MEEVLQPPKVDDFNFALILHWPTQIWMWSLTKTQTGYLESPKLYLKDVATYKHCLGLYITESINQPIDQWINGSSDQSTIDQSIDNRSIDRLIDQLINQSIN